MEKRTEKEVITRKAKIGTAIIHAIKSIGLHVLSSLILASVVLFRLETGTDI